MITALDKIEARIYPTGFEIRDLDVTESLRKLAGRAVPYNTPTDLGTFTEEISPGTFTRSIKQDGMLMPLHIFHGDAPKEGGSPATPWPIGTSSEWVERSDGLHGVWDLDEDPEAQRAARLAKAGKLPYLSVRFQPFPNKTDIRYVGDRPHLIRHQARLVSTSLVTTPAYLGATVDWVRSAEQVARPGAPGTALAEWAAYLERVKTGPLA
jgi:HK97 family phage prohead protease